MFIKSLPATYPLTQLLLTSKGTVALEVSTHTGHSSPWIPKEDNDYHFDPGATSPTEPRAEAPQMEDRSVVLIQHQSQVNEKVLCS